jgi:ketosteroid isomerase-like protein
VPYDVQMKTIATCTLALALFLQGCATAAPPRSAPPRSAAPGAVDQRLYDEIARMDATMFDAYNRHDLEGLMALFSDDLEFYHDSGGRLALAEVRGGFKNIFDRHDGIQRELVPGSLEVYPIKGFGAIEIGAHRFCHVENGRDDCGTFRFVQVWQQTGANWKVSRVVSYGH